ncbi:MAG: hypothetical protein WAM82_03935 [Thermoanaerobaculia bacterium]
MSQESHPQMLLRFRDAETHSTLQRVSETLGVPMDELVETAIRRELAALEGNLEPRLQRAVELLRSYQPDVERDIAEFARAEVTVDDPLRSRRDTESVNVYRILGLNRQIPPQEEEALSNMLEGFQRLVRYFHSNQEPADRNERDEEPS